MSISLDEGPVAEWVPVSAGPEPGGLPRISIDVLHDGDRLGGPGPLALRSEVREAFERLRAHGTEHMAGHLAAALGQPGFVAVRLARVTLDLDLLPGVDPRGRSRSLGLPLAGLIGSKIRRSLIDGAYRAALAVLSEARYGARLSLSLLARDGGGRPRLLAAGDPASPPIFVDPLVPPALLERTADPFLVDILREALGSDLEEEALTPLLAPTSLAVRGTVFSWMKYLQGVLEGRGRGRGEPIDRVGLRMWSALLDTSGLSAETWSVRGHLHHGLEAPCLERLAYGEMESHYRRLETWVAERRPELIRGYFAQAARRDHLVLELPKDSPDPERWAEVAAQAIRKYFAERAEEGAG